MLNRKLLFLSLGLVTLSSGAWSNNIINAKCYLELAGGGETVNFFSLPAVNGNKIDIESIAKISVIPIGGKVKRPIYKIIECVKEDRLFKNSKANKLERDAVW